MNEKILSLILLINVIYSVRADDVLGCGGFLKSHVPIDFSKVTVKLFTKQGILKDQTNCAPNNGYYFIPLYDKGEYILQLEPPPGWSFDPMKINVAVNGKTDVCSKGQDINFVFKGFGITGKVESVGSSEGPSGVDVKLISDTDVRVTTTGDNGLFSFTPVYPGVHTVTISHPKWKLKKNSIVVTVAEGNTELVPKSLQIAGYDVSGVVKTDGEPVNGVILMLHSIVKPIHYPDGCIKELPENVAPRKNYLCHVISNSRGEFEFPTVPNGFYSVIPFYRGGNVHFDPKGIDFDVQHGSVRLPKTFEIVGFSVVGRVLSHEKGDPLPGATIYINGEQAATTDESGLYSYDKMKAGTYTVSVKAENYDFDDRTLKITPSTSQMSDVYPSHYLVCGKVTSEVPLSVKVERIDSTETSSYTIDTEPRSGKFCDYLRPGKYQFRVIVDDEDKRKGIQFFPLSQTVVVSSSPKLDLLFSQLKAEVTGTVKCYNPKECASLKVILRPVTNDVSQEETDVTSAVVGDAYKFNDIRPGTYEVSLAPNRFCWEHDKKVVTVDGAVLNVPPFVQRGYAVTFMSSHGTKLKYQTETKDTKTLAIGQGHTTQCVESRGKYAFVINGCHTYAADVVEYDTDSPINEITLTALKHRHTIGLRSLKDYGSVSVKVVDDKIHSVPYRDGKYSLELYLGPQESVILIPQSDVLYFNPPILMIEGTDDCRDLGDKFDAVKGMVFRGRVTPALAGVQVTVTSGDSESLTNETDSEGFYRFQPLDSTKTYKVTAVKDSYVLVGPDDDGNFVAHKLAKIIVDVVDQTNNSPLQGTLLSLSGDQSYRSNLQTNEEGRVVFGSLSPSEYFLRPMMKEYSFEPTSQIINVKEGATVNIQLKGKRVAYSAFGQITSLNGEPEEKVIVVSSGLGNCSHYSEEATSEVTGHFRIRGLLPYCSYVLEVKGSLNSGDRFERTAPRSIQLGKIADDIHDLNMIVFRPPSTVDVLVKVHTPNPDHYRSLRVKLMKESQPSGLISQTKLDTTNYKVTDQNTGILLQLSVVPLDNKQYSVSLETTLSQLNKHKPPVEYFIANNSFKYIELNFAINESTNDQNIKQTSAWTLIFIFGMMVAIYNIEKIWQAGQNIVSKINLDIFGSKGKSHEKDYANDNNDIDQIVQSINATKKKPKAKKI